MASVFREAKEILLIDYLEKGESITGEYYAVLLEKLKTAIAEKRPGMIKKRCCSTTAHRCIQAAEKLTELRFKILSHPLYSPDLAPSDYYLFSKLKTFLAGQKFWSNEEVIQNVNEYFEDLEKTHFREGIMNLEKRWGKCVESRRDSVEK